MKMLLIMKNYLIPNFTLLLISFFLSSEVTGKYQFKRVHTGLVTPKPISVVLVPDGSGKEILVLQGGKALVLPKDRSSGKEEVFLDISGKNLIEKAFEEGLLGIAFHPKFKKNKKFYVYYTLQNPKRTRLVEMRMNKKDPSKPDLKYERLLLEVPQPYWNHNSGNPVFGPDGYLYLSLGDGGKANDPLNLAQNPFLLWGKVLRIDVNSRSGALPYGIPKDNPFVGKEGHRPEIWALGLRNPWSIHWDMQTKTLFCADVGQNQREEINVIVKGGNYGWSFREGSIAFPLNRLEPPANVKFVEPIFDYDRTLGLSVSGGIVYRGKSVPSLRGSYLFGDWGTGNLWALRYSDGKTKDVRKLEWSLVNAPKGETKEPGIPEKITKGSFKPVNFCHGANGELLVLDWNGVVYEVSEK